MARSRVADDRQDSGVLSIVERLEASFGEAVAQAVEAIQEQVPTIKPLPTSACATTSPNTSHRSIGR